VGENKCTYLGVKVHEFGGEKAAQLIVRARVLFGGWRSCDAASRKCSQRLYFSLGAAFFTTRPHIERLQHTNIFLLAKTTKYFLLVACHFLYLFCLRISDKL
jgi:hypothetical protein